MSYDVDKLSKTGWRFFRDQMKEWYKYEFKELSEEYKNKAIDYVIEHNTEIFTREFVLSENLCFKCGLCCRDIGCPDLDKETNLCTKHNNQNTQMCYEYPWSDVGLVFDYNCGYQRAIFMKYMDLYFSKALELFETAGNKVLEGKDE